MPYKFGDIVLVPFPFTDQTAFKKRPAVVVGSRNYNDIKPDLVMMGIISQLRPQPTLGEVWIAEWHTPA
jgi:mRNA interferase MazF